MYLPINSAEFPSLKKQLQTELANSGLEQIQIKTADFWNGYQQGIRLGQAGIYFAAPHYTAWAVHQHDFTPFIASI